MQGHSTIADHDQAWAAAMADLGFDDVLTLTREEFSEALRLATRILYFEKTRRNEEE